MVKKLLTLTFVLGSIFTQSSNAALDPALQIRLLNSGYAAIHELLHLNQIMNDNSAESAQIMLPILPTMQEVIRDHNNALTARLQDQFGVDTVAQFQEQLTSPNGQIDPTSDLVRTMITMGINDMPHLLEDLEAVVRPQITEFMRTHLENGAVDEQLLIDIFTSNIIRTFLGGAIGGEILNNPMMAQLATPQNAQATQRNSDPEALQATMTMTSAMQDPNLQRMAANAQILAQAGVSQEDIFHLAALRGL